MCRSCTEVPGGRRCPGETTPKRRARQNAAYHAKKHSTGPREPESGADDATDSAGLPPLEGPVSEEMVRKRVEHARTVLERADDRPSEYIEGATRSGEPLTVDNGNGWQVPTEYGLEAEAATRAAGAAVAARAEEMVGPGLEKVPQDKTVLKFAPEGPQSREEYAASVQRNADALSNEVHQKRTEAMEASERSETLRLSREANELVPEANTYLVEASHVEQGDSAWDRAESKVYSDAYRQALAEQRDMGLPDGQMIAVDEKSQKATTERLKKGLHYYPSEWLARDGSYEAMVQLRGGIMGDQDFQEHVPLRVTSTSKRAHYADMVTESRRNRQTGQITHKRYSELTIGKRDVGCLGPGVSTAVHEYGHRAERVQSRVNDLAQTHLARRTTHEDGERHELEPYLVGAGRARSGPSQSMSEYERRDEGKSEWVRSDDFAEQYTGKQNSTREVSSEVFTTGMEGVFAGRFGGLRGAGRWKEDREHRDFILGSLATVK